MLSWVNSSSSWVAVLAPNSSMSGYPYHGPDGAAKRMWPDGGPTGNDKEGHQPIWSWNMDMDRPGNNTKPQGAGTTFAGAQARHNGSLGQPTPTAGTGKGERSFARNVVNLPTDLLARVLNRTRWGGGGGTFFFNVGPKFNTSTASALPKWNNSVGPHADAPNSSRSGETGHFELNRGGLFNLFNIKLRNRRLSSTAEEPAAVLTGRPAEEAWALGVFQGGGGVMGAVGGFKGAGVMRTVGGYKGGAGVMGAVGRVQMSQQRPMPTVLPGQCVTCPKGSSANTAGTACRKIS